MRERVIRGHAYSGSACFLLAVLGSPTVALAQAPHAAPPPDGAHPAPQAAPAGCFPACRQGYLCSGGACISACNPPCPAGQTCVAGQYCEAPPREPQLFEPPPPRRKTFAERTHSALAFHMGVGGTVEVDGAENDLGTTLGFSLRSDVPVARYLLVGPLFQFGAWHPDTGGDPTDNYYGDLSLFLRGRIPLEPGALGVQLWGGLPIGLTLHFLGSDAARTQKDVGIGWNVGALFGGAVHFNRQLGMFAEVGFMQHRMRHDPLQRGSVARYRLGQANINVGFMFGN